MKTPILPTYKGYLSSILILLILFLLDSSYQFYSRNTISTNYLIKSVNSFQFENKNEETNIDNEYYKKTKQIIITNN